MMKVEPAWDERGYESACGVLRISFVFLMLAWVGTGGVPRALGQDPDPDSVSSSDAFPVRRAALDLAELLGDMPGTFLYRFGTPGWPEGWSYHGLSPQRAAMTLNDVPFSHVFTGRPGFDIAPLAFVGPLHIERARFHRAVSAATRLRPFAGSAPITEMKYWKGAAGLESIDAVHAQHRSRSMFGRPGFLNVMGAYSGRGSTGVYAGSRLRRGRQVQLRLRYEQGRWGVEVLNIQTRRTIGAHGGVIPDASGFESIYATLGAVVENPQATRRIVRNDLHATGRFNLLGTSLSVGAFWTAETFRYRDEADTVGTGSDRMGFRVLLPILSRPGRSTAVEIDAWTDRIAPRLGFSAPPLRRTELHAAIRDSVTVFGWNTGLRLSASAYDGGLHPGASVDVARPAGAVQVVAGGVLSGEPASPVELMGFKALGAAPDGGTGRILETFAGLSWTAGPFDFHVRAQVNRTTHPRDVYMTTDYMAEPDSAAVLFASSAVVRAGATLDAGWRRDAERGLYVLLQPSFVKLVNHGDSERHERLARAMPEWYGGGRLGVRALLFRGDLDVDAFVDAYVWGGAAMRTLHPETGLLAVPLLSSRMFEPSAMINLGAEAGVREATFFFHYQNAIAATSLMTGNMIVPVYPLPGRQFRFGVYWPIFN